MAKPAWQMSGEFMESCNCDYLCPCIFTDSKGAVTHDHCTVAMAYRIDEGWSGAVRLDGLKFALMMRSGKVMADGNWIAGAVIDATANPAQRDALTAIVSGKAGGAPAVIHDTMIRDFRGVLFQPIEFTMRGLVRSVAIPGLLSYEIGGVTAGGQGEPMYIDNSPHPANPRVALARTTESHVHGFGLDLDLVGKGNNGHFASFTWSA